jgi:FimV-like protein
MKLIGIAEESRGSDRCHPQTLERLYAILPKPQDADGAAENVDTINQAQRSTEGMAQEQTDALPAADGAPHRSAAVPANENSALAACASLSDNGDSHDGSDMGIKLHLATAYQEIGEADGARLLLDEVIEHGTKDQSEKARRMLAKLA